MSETFLILRGTERDMTKKMYSCVHVKYRYPCQILTNLNFLDRFSLNTQMLNFKKIRLVGAEIFHTEVGMDGQTNVTKLIVAFRNFSKAPKNVQFSINPLCNRLPLNSDFYLVRLNESTMVTIGTSGQSSSGMW